MKKTRCGFVALVGRPNVGKSTLLNKLIGQKISITSRKPQTTRHRIAGVLTQGDDQLVFVDTPGLHRKAPYAMNRMMNKTALGVLREVDVVVWMVDVTKWTEEDEWINEKIIPSIKVPVILVLNKIDCLKDRDSLLPRIEAFYQTKQFKAVIPLSAKTVYNLESLVQEIKQYLPENPFFYAEDQVTDRSIKFLCAELIREKVMRLTGAEVPYAMTIEIEKFEEKNNITHIYALIWVEKENQKAIIIGEAGERLKRIGSEARLDMEAMLEQKVFLKLWCKVKSGWSDDERALQSLGYG
ncbi:MAG: GTPase Era [Gammaproteobacteria bacterium]|nr:GTPase Era [Gammaproteobacteria bacterium]